MTACLQLGDYLMIAGGVFMAMVIGYFIGESM